MLNGNFALNDAFVARVKIDDLRRSLRKGRRSVLPLPDDWPGKEEGHNFRGSDFNSTINPSFISNIYSFCVTRF